MRLLCFGDSNTYGYDPRSYLGGRYGETVRWPCLLAERAGVELTERGENGRGIPHREYQLSRAAFELTRAGAVDALTVMLGGNDLLMEPDFTAEDVTERMEVFLEYARRLPELAGARILLISPPAMRPGAWVNERRLIHESGRLAEFYGGLAARLGLDFLRAPERPGSLDFDGVHLTETGHRLLSEAVLPWLLSVRDGHPLF